MIEPETKLEKVREARENFKEKFPEYVGAFMGPEELKTLFQYTETEMDVKCREVFNMGFRELYKYYYMDVLREGKDVVEAMAREGNNVALKMYGEAMLKLGREDQQKEARVTVTFDVPDGKR